MSDDASTTRKAWRSSHSRVEIPFKQLLQFARVDPGDYEHGTKLHLKIVGVQSRDAKCERTSATRPSPVLVVDVSVYAPGVDTTEDGLVIPSSELHDLHDRTIEDPAVVKDAMLGNQGGKLAPCATSTSTGYTPTSPKYGSFTGTNPYEREGATDPLPFLSDTTDKKRKYDTSTDDANESSSVKQVKVKKEVKEEGEQSETEEEYNERVRNIVAIGATRRP